MAGKAEGKHRTLTNVEKAKSPSSMFVVETGTPSVIGTHYADYYEHVKADQAKDEARKFLTQFKSYAERYGDTTVEVDAALEQLDKLGPEDWLETRTEPFYWEGKVGWATWAIKMWKVGLR